MIKRKVAPGELWLAAAVGVVFLDEEQEIRQSELQLRLCSCKESSCALVCRPLLSMMVNGIARLSPLVVVLLPCLAFDVLRISQHCLRLEFDAFEAYAYQEEQW